ncbi:MAG: S41 family peptidase [Planctomycetota bacterium]
MPILPRFRSLFGYRLSRVGAVAAVFAAFAPFSAGQSGGDAQLARSLEAWSDQLWSSAESDQVKNALELVRDLPAGAQAQPELNGLASAIEQFRTNIEQREQSRAEQIAEARSEFADASTQNDVPAMLDAVFELHQLSTDKEALLAEPQVAAALTRADLGAQEAEASSDWLEALMMYSRLDLIFEDQERYEDALKRAGRRLELLRLYVPERLHELRNEQLVAEGEEPLPEFNDFGEDWRDRLAGVDDRMVTEAIARAAEEHVERVGIEEMLVGGLESVRTLATTRDLARQFPGIDNQVGVHRLKADIDFAIRRLEALNDGGDHFHLVKTIRDLDAANRESQVNLPKEVWLHEFGDGAMDALDDYTEIIWPDEREQFDRSLQGAFTGVGIQISLTEAYELEVVTPIAGTPAFHAGLKAGDLINRIDGRPTLGITLNQAVEQITGPAGTTVTLSIERVVGDEDQEFEVVLTRARIPLHTVKGWRRVGTGELDWDWFIDREAGLGYVRVTSFNNDTTKEASDAIRSMKREGLNGVILDLRYNPGGLLSQAVRLTNLFVRSGIVVTQEDRAGRTVERHAARWGRHMVDDDIPVVVLINGGSASASEIVAGALQDFGRAILVGDQSFGKGSVQQVFEVGRRNAALFKLTTGYYKLPDGRLIHRGRANAAKAGVAPHIKVEMLPEQVADALDTRREADVYSEDADGRPIFVDPAALIDEGEDPQLETALLLLRSRVAINRALASLDAPGE